VFWVSAGPRKGDGLTPRDEEFVSNYIAAMLRRELSPRGISVTRESEVARGIETDIRVEAPPNVSEGRPNAALVTIEVKCIWNRDVTESLTSQVGDRYLRLAGRKHGIYVVVDFAREHWSDVRPTGKADTRLADAGPLTDGRTLPNCERVDRRCRTAAALSRPPRVERPGRAPSLNGKPNRLAASS